MNEKISGDFLTMLEKSDLELIRGVIREEVGEALEQVVLPKFDYVNDEISGMKSDISGMKSEIHWIKANMVTKDFLEERLARFKVELANSAIWVANQVTRLTQVLHKNGVLTAEQVVSIRTG